MSSHLHQICIPSIATDMQVIVATLLSRRLPEYVPFVVLSARVPANPQQFWQLTIFRRAHETACHLRSAHVLNNGNFSIDMFVAKKRHNFGDAMK